MGEDQYTLANMMMYNLIDCCHNAFAECFRALAARDDIPAPTDSCLPRSLSLKLSQGRCQQGWIMIWQWYIPTQAHLSQILNNSRREFQMLDNRCRRLQAAAQWAAIDSLELTMF